MLTRLSNLPVMIRLLWGYLLVGVLKHLAPLRWLARRMWCTSTGPRDLESERRLAAIVLQMSRLFDCNCLQFSLVLYRLLSRAGANPILVTGFRRKNGRILGHAWVIVDGRAVIEESGADLEFSPMFAFGVDGTLLPAAPHARASLKS